MAVTGSAGRVTALVPTIGGDILAVREGADSSLSVATRVLYAPGSLARVPHTTSVLLTSFESYADRSISRLSVPDLREVERVRLSDIESRSLAGGKVDLGFGGPYSLDTSGTIAAFASTTVDGVPGVTAVDTKTWTVAWFLGPFFAVSVAYGIWRDQDVLFVGGSRASGPSYAPMLWIIDASSRRIVDSIALGGPTNAPGGSVQQVLSSRSAGRILVLIAGAIVSCPTSAPGGVCRRMASPAARGSLSYREGDLTALMNDAGSRDGDSSGAIYSVALDASHIERYDLPLVNGRPASTRGVSSSATGSMWYISAGSSPYAGGQPSRLLFYDPKSRSIVRSLPSNLEILSPFAL